MPNSISISIKKELLASFVSKEVVVTETNNELHIREALIDDTKRLKIRKCGYVTYTSERAKEFLGEVEIEFDEETESIIVYHN